MCRGAKSPQTSLSLIIILNGTSNGFGHFKNSFNGRGKLYIFLDWSFNLRNLEVSISELWKKHQLEPGLVRNLPWQRLRRLNRIFRVIFLHHCQRHWHDSHRPHLDDSEEDFGDGWGVVVKRAWSVRPDRVLHRGIEAWVNDSLEGRPRAEF